MSVPNESITQEEEQGAQALPLALSWLLVGVPALWGIWQVVVKSMSLFRR